MRGYRSRLLPELGIIICIIGIILANNIAVSGDQSEVQHTNDLVWGTLLLGYEEILVPEQTIYLMNGLEVHADYVHLANWIYYDVYYEITRLSDNASIHKEPVYEDHIGDGTGGWKSITPSSFSQEGIYQINYTIHDTTNDIVGSMIKTFEVNSSNHYKAPEIISTYGIENGSSYSENLNVKSFIISELQILEGFASI